MKLKPHIKKRKTGIFVLSFIGISLLLISITFSCGKYAGNVDSNYIGTWHSDTLTHVDSGDEVYNYIIIDGKKNSEYGFLCNVTCPSCGCFVINKGNAKINNKKTSLTIGSRKSTTFLKIQESPALIDGKWVMKIKDLWYYKQ